MPGKDAIAIFNGALIPGAPEEPMLAATLLLAAVDMYGGTVLLGADEDRWSPHTIEMEIAQDAGGLVDSYFGKLMTAIELLTTDHFTTSLPDFIRICNTLGDSPGGDSPDWAEPDEIAWALMEYSVIGGAEADYKFHPEIMAYTRKKLLGEGFTKVPDPLQLITGTPGEQLVTPGSDQDTSDDPDIFADVQSRQEDLGHDLTRHVVGRLQLLLQQVGLLPVSTPHTKGWRENVLNEIKKVFTNDESAPA